MLASDPFSASEFCRVCRDEDASPTEETKVDLEENSGNPDATLLKNGALSTSPTASSSSNPKDELTYPENDADFDDGNNRLLAKKRYRVVFVVTIAVISIVVVLLSTLLPSKPSPATINISTRRSMAPSISPVILETPDEKLEVIRAALQDNPVMMKYVSLLPNDPVSLLGKKDDPSSHAIIRAASWLIYDDSINRADKTVLRFSLAAIYYATNGERWFESNSKNWLSNNDACSWFGVECSFSTLAVNQVDLSSSGLTGEIPDTFSMLPEIRSLALNDNSLSGTIPGGALGSIPRLAYLYLQNNKLSGEIPPSLDSNKVLTTLYVYGNVLNGTWPSAFCPSCEGCANPLSAFGLDCERNPCPEGCCTDFENCF